MKNLEVLKLVLILTVGSDVAYGHHSFANFDSSKSIVLTGSVRAWEWTNPHSWLWLDVVDEHGATVTWGLEGSAPGELTREGWTKSSLKPGDKITVSIHPLKNGQTGGSFSKVIFADGHTLGKDGGNTAPPSAASAPSAGGE